MATKAELVERIRPKVHRAPFVGRPRAELAKVLREELRISGQEVRAGMLLAGGQRLEMAIIGTIADCLAVDVDDWEEIFSELECQHGSPFWGR